LGKKSKRKKRPVQLEINKPEISQVIYDKYINGKFKGIRLLPAVISLAAAAYFLFSSYKANGYFGFPLDDPWIHLNFAKNLVNY